MKVIVFHVVRMWYLFLQITIICKISIFVDKDFKTKTGSRSLAR